MRKLLIGLAVSLLVVNSSLAETLEMNIATGRPSGTYYQFGQDISRLVAKKQIDLQVLTSQGSVENLLNLWDRRSVQLAISQSDVLFFMAKLGDEPMRRLVNEFRVVMPLYLEEAHLIATSDINSLDDLNGKRVAIGDPGSGTAMTSELFLGINEIQPAAVVEVGGEQALEGLKEGALDAMIYVAGAPVRLLEERVSAEDGLHLVPIVSSALQEMYGPTVTIPGGTYSWQADAVETVAVEAALMTLAYPELSPECASVNEVSAAIVEGMDWLKQKGHEKWASVDIESTVAESNRSDCSKLYQASN